MCWSAYDDGKTKGKFGSEGGRIIRNENYFYSICIARKELNTVCAVTVGVHDAFVHTAYFGNAKVPVKYEQMKSELGEFIAWKPPRTKSLNFTAILRTNIKEQQ